MNDKTYIRECEKLAARQGRAGYHHIMKFYGEAFLANLPRKMYECIKATSNQPDILFLPEHDLPRRMISILAFMEEAIKCDGVNQEDLEGNIEIAKRIRDYPFLAQNAFI